jgi:protein PhnA
MINDKKLLERSNGKCELCGSDYSLFVYSVEPASPSFESSLVLCETCDAQVKDADKMDTNHWRCLNDSMWSEVDAVKVLSWRMLNRLKSEGWPQDLLDMMYLDEELLSWAKATGEDVNEEDKIVHRDSNGAVLQNGDTVVLIKELDVKGATFSAKRGTAVRNIRLVQDNAEQIEGKIEGQSIIILTKFVKK